MQRASGRPTHGASGTGFGVELRTVSSGQRQASSASGSGSSAADAALVIKHDFVRFFCALRPDVDATVAAKYYDVGLTLPTLQPARPQRAPSFAVSASSISTSSTAPPADGGVPSGPRRSLTQQQQAAAAGNAPLPIALNIVQFRQLLMLFGRVVARKTASAARAAAVAAAVAAANETEAQTRAAGAASGSSSQGASSRAVNALHAAAATTASQRVIMAGGAAAQPTPAAQRFLSMTTSPPSSMPSSFTEGAGIMMHGGASPAYDNDDGSFDSDGTPVPAAVAVVTSPLHRGGPVSAVSAPSAAAATQRDAGAAAGALPAQASAVVVVNPMSGVASSAPVAAGGGVTAGSGPGRPAAAAALPSAAALVDASSMQSDASALSTIFEQEQEDASDMESILGGGGAGGSGIRHSNSLRSDGGRSSGGGGPSSMSPPSAAAAAALTGIGKPSSRSPTVSFSSALPTSPPTAGTDRLATAPAAGTDTAGVVRNPLALGLMSAGVSDRSLDSAAGGGGGGGDSTIRTTSPESHRMGDAVPDSFVPSAASGSDGLNASRSISALMHRGARDDGGIAQPWGATERPQVDDGSASRSGTARLGRATSASWLTAGGGVGRAGSRAGMDALWQRSSRSLAYSDDASTCSCTPRSFCQALSAALAIDSSRSRATSRSRRAGSAAGAASPRRRGSRLARSPSVRRPGSRGASMRDLSASPRPSDADGFGVDGEEGEDGYDFEDEDDMEDDDDLFDGSATSAVCCSCCRRKPPSAGQPSGSGDAAVSTWRGCFQRSLKHMACTLFFDIIVALNSVAVVTQVRDCRCFCWRVAFGKGSAVLARRCLHTLFSLCCCSLPTKRTMHPRRPSPNR